MVIKEINYYIKGHKKRIRAKICKTPTEKITGLMFRKNSLPLLFIFNKEKDLSIHSFFCSPFKAIWLDKNMRSTKIIDVRDWRLNLSGRGKYLLEIPKTTKK